MSGWIEEIRQGLQLSPAGVLILVDHAVPEKLGALVRALLADHPDLDVLTDVAELSQASDGAVVVFLPKASDAGWLNLNRPMFARKALKVVLFCEREVTEALSRQAPDFYDWISHRQECPAGAAEHAIWGIRRALLARAPGILFGLDGFKDNRVEHVERVFQEALPGRQLLWLDPYKMTYEELVRRIQDAGRAWVACNSEGPASAERFRWALAEARRRTRAVLLVPEVFEDRFWTISDAIWTPMSEATAFLAGAGAKHPGRLAAVTGLEIGVVMSLVELLARSYPEEALLHAMLQSEDPGAGLAERILSSGIVDRPLAAGIMSAPVRRHLGRRVGLRRKFPGRRAREVEGWSFDGDGYGFPLLTGRAAQIEAVLCAEDRTTERWIQISRLALDHGHPDAAARWAERVIATAQPKRSSEGYRLLGLAFAEIGYRNRREDHPAWILLHQLAEQALREAEETLDPSTPPEDALALYATRADILMRFGAGAEAEQPLDQALRLVDAPLARVRDIERVARMLRAKRRPDRAEEILKRALERTADPTEQARIRLGLGWCAFRAGRINEALSIAEALSNEQERYSWDANREEVRAGPEELRIHALLTRNEPERALVLCDAELTRAAKRWGQASSHAFFWIPLLARALRHAGRARDAELILRKLLDLPLEVDAATVALGLSSRTVVLSFLNAPAGHVLIGPRQHRDLQDELVQALRAQGRHLEADALEPRPEEDRSPP
ncbi:MAG TPA: tetratricopeptide repeat protein [Polyangiaceae bacterium]|nr:tetratricopeptide repeat protein [Polyangiaceae bacterium]